MSVTNLIEQIKKKEIKAFYHSEQKNGLLRANFIKLLDCTFSSRSVEPRR